LHVLPQVHLSITKALLCTATHNAQLALCWVSQNPLTCHSIVCIATHIHTESSFWPQWPSSGPAPLSQLSSAHQHGSLAKISNVHTTVKNSLATVYTCKYKFNITYVTVSQYQYSMFMCIIIDYIYCQRNRSFLHHRSV
jgi:hypothetical protein